MNKIIVSLIVILVSSNGYAQDQHKIDSLNTALQKHEAWKKSLGSNATPMIDTTKADILYLLSRAYYTVDWEKELSYARECLALSEKIGYKKGVANAYNNIGVFYKERGEYVKAKECNAKVLKIRFEINDIGGISGSYNNIGLVYLSEGNSGEALRNYLIALEYAEKGKNRLSKAALLNNIGTIYKDMGNHLAAFDNYNKAMKINREMGNKVYLNANLTNLGVLQFNLKKYSESLLYYFEALSLGQELHRSEHQTLLIYRDIARNYESLQDYPSALKYYDSVLFVANKSKNKDFVVFAFIKFGTVYEKQNRLNEALSNLQKALKITLESSKEEGLDSHEIIYQELWVIYKKMKNYKLACEYYDKYEAVREKTEDIDVAKNNVAKLTQLLSQSAFDKQQDSTKAEQEKRDAVTEAEKQRSNQQKYFLLTAFSMAIVFAYLDNRKKKRISKEKKRSEDLLLNILPAEVAEELKTKGTADAKHFDNVTVLFTDFKSFTTVSEQLSPQELVNELHACFKQFDEIITKYTIEKIKTIGDAYLAVCGLPLADEMHAENVVNAAMEIREFMEKRRQKLGEKTFEVRIGINSGSVVAGIVGVKKFAYDIWGDTVNTAARMEQNSEAGKINISETTYELVKDSFICEYRGEIDAKNKGKLKMYFVEEI
ncbi:MAG: tetratricopeptide repeat protein [Bacteroidetes bacterium]|nr:tetratricopeptide repeat protein [Bacteroidota bacterium]